MRLTVTEYNTVYQGILKKFADEQTHRFNENLYKISTAHSPIRLKKLFLFCYALSTWDNSDTAYNYLTEVQMFNIVEKAK